ncbi:unnamed protein product, partial [Scytosiphon promiscuus]
ERARPTYLAPTASSRHKRRPANDTEPSSPPRRGRTATRSPSSGRGSSRLLPARASGAAAAATTAAAPARPVFRPSGVAKPVPFSPPSSPSPSPPRTRTRKHSPLERRESPHSRRPPPAPTHLLPSQRSRSPRRQSTLRSDSRLLFSSSLTCERGGDGGGQGGGEVGGGEFSRSPSPAAKRTARREQGERSSLSVSRTAESRGAQLHHGRQQHRRHHQHQQQQQQQHQQQQQQQQQQRYQQHRDRHERCYPTPSPQPRRASARAGEPQGVRRGGGGGGGKGESGRDRWDEGSGDSG